MTTVQKNRCNSITRGWNAAFAAILILACLTVLLPVALVVIVSLSSAESIANIGYSFFPQSWSLVACRALLATGTQIGNSYKVTIAHTCLGTVFTYGDEVILHGRIFFQDYRLPGVLGASSQPSRVPFRPTEDTTPLPWPTA